MSMVVHKFATGQPIPDGAVYLATVKQEQILETIYNDTWQRDLPVFVAPCWLVWHYFLVDSPQSGGTT